MKLSQKEIAQLNTAQITDKKEEQKAQASWERFIESMKAKGALITHNGNGQTKIKI
jgi:hypothetical protein